MSFDDTPLYPDAFDSDDNLYNVKGSLRVRLAEDYSPGDTTIVVEGDPLVMSRWPSKGLITLTEQCSDVEDRAVSFFYDAFDISTLQFTGLALLPGFRDVAKLKRITYVTQNVMDRHHNVLKDALIAIEEFVGIKGTIDERPFGDTMEGRTNFVRKIALIPRAWFTADRRTGLVPLEVEFRDLSFRLGTDGIYGPVSVTWDFGDNTTSSISGISVISGTSVVPEGADDIYFYDEDGGKITKTYVRPGIYDVTLTVRNGFGEDVCKFESFIQARLPAPEPVVLRFQDSGDHQRVTPGSPSNGPYTVFPKIRSPINTLIGIEIPTGENVATPNHSYGGELLDEDGDAIDPITSYTWVLGDDLNHPNARETKAAYSVGGIYDLKVRVDTTCGAYRISTYEDSIDIVENMNLWYWVFQDSLNARSYEYGLISETFKLNSNSSYPILRNDAFLDGVPEEEKQKTEFRKNVGFAPLGTTNSGNAGSTLLYWASGRNADDPISIEEIKIAEYNGFQDSYVTRSSLTRPWNWASFSSSSTAFFAFGSPTSTPDPDTSPTNLQKTSLNLVSLAATSATMTGNDFLQGASDLMQNPSIFDADGESVYGHFSVYRTAWKGSLGYIARNGGVGPYFRINNFYRTEGTAGSPFQQIRKLSDIGGAIKYEGEMVPLSKGIYFFNNTGSISEFEESSGIWRQGGPGVNSQTYRAFQDTTVSGYDSATNTLLAASDSDRRAYITFDYSPSVFMKFTEIDTTFSSLGSRPSGDQFLMGVY
jgi:PKD repeat protein